MKLVLRDSATVPMVSRMIVPSTTSSQFAAFMRATCDEKSVAPRLKVVFSVNSLFIVFRPASAPLSTSVPKSSSW